MTTPQKKRLKNPIQKYNDLSEDQAIAKKVIDENDITCLLGRAGSGKTHLAVTYALEKLAIGRKSGGVTKIVITRPTTFRKEDSIGFLPGDIAEKLDPFLQPIYDVLNVMEGVDKTEKMMKDKMVEICPLAYIQGRTFKDAIIIIDESQNLSKDGAEGVFTRLGKSSKMIFCGDPKQSLIEDRTTGLDRLIQLSEVVDGLESYMLTTNFRHELVEQLLKVY